jgi:hypothetical protein
MKAFRHSLVLALLLAAAPAPAAAPKGGNWELALSSGPGVESVQFIVKLDVKDDGTLSGSLTAAPPGTAADQFGVERVAMEGDILRIALKSPVGEIPFEGVVTKPDGPILGSVVMRGRVMAARMAPTDKTELTRANAIRRAELPEEMTKAQEVAMKGRLLRARAARVQEKEEKAKLLKEADAAERAARDELPKLYGAVIEKHPGTPAAADAALTLIRTAARAGTPADRVKALAGVVTAAAAGHGPRYARESAVQVGELLASQRPYAALAVEYLAAAEKGLTDKDPADEQVRILEVLAVAHRHAGRAAEADATDARVARLNEPLDGEYKAKMPPFKPDQYEGRKGAGDRVAVMELFTGAQCPPCVAADLAFDALVKTYKPADVILLQHHLHIPGPDPMTNPATEARWAYYRERFANEVRGVPSSVFGGKPQAGGGGGTAQAKAKYEQYRKIIDELLETPAGAGLTLSARRQGGTVVMDAEVSDLKEPGEDKRLRFVVAEEEIRYQGSNNIRFHHMVVRDMPGGPDGFKLTDKAGKFTAKVDVDRLKGELNKYLDEASERMQFPKPTRPLALKHLKVIALVQDDKTGEILQAAVADLGGERAER